jgi:4-hydroxy-tetrahydrodipicolinate synthase
MKALVTAFASGDTEQALRWHRDLYPLFRALFLETNPVPVKAALEMLGKSSAEVRLPLAPVSEATRHKLAEALRGLRLL